MTYSLMNKFIALPLMSINIITMLTNSFLNIWFFMEINTMLMYFLMSNQKLPCWKSIGIYFSIQSISSAFIMLFICMKQYGSTMMPEKYLTLLMVVALMLKMGLFPVHMWPPHMMTKMSWLICFILMTFQKIPPFMLMMNLDLNNWMLFMVPPTAVLSAIMNVYTPNLKKILGLASNVHSSWMLVCMQISFKIWFTYFCIYTLMMMVTCYLMNLSNIKYGIKDSGNIKNFPPSMKVIMISMSISLLSVPPSSMFIIKWMPLEICLHQGHWLVALFLIFSTLFSVIYYLRITLSLFMKSYPVTSQLKSWNWNKISLLILITVIFITSPLLIISWLHI